MLTVDRISDNITSLACEDERPLGICTVPPSFCDRYHPVTMGLEQSCHPQSHIADGDDPNSDSAHFVEYTLTEVDCKPQCCATRTYISINGAGSFVSVSAGGAFEAGDSNMQA